jgi:hypothetical protein
MLRHDTIQTSIDAHGHHFPTLALYVHSDFPNTDLQKVIANKIKRVQACIDTSGHHFRHLLEVHSDFPKADLQKAFANKIKRVQVCIDASGHHFRHLLEVHSDFPNVLYKNRSHPAFYTMGTGSFPGGSSRGVALNTHRHLAQRVKE